MLVPGESYFVIDDRLIEIFPFGRPGGNSMMGLSEDCLYLNIFTKNLIKRNNYDQVGTKKK